MSTLVATLQGRTGNQIMQWLFCYAFAQKYGMTFECEEWIGERIFALPKYGRPIARWFRVNERELIINAPALADPSNQNSFLEFRGYAQSQPCMIYSKREAQSWLKLRPEIAMMCGAIVNTLNGSLGDRPILCHRRVGDYKGYSYPICSADSYSHAMVEYGLDASLAAFVTEENPTPHAPLPDDISFVVDFYRMVNAKVLLRGNSSFSWVAGLLGNGLVLSPVIDGLEGGKEHTVNFVAGNHPKFAPHLDFVTDLYVSP